MKSQEIKQSYLWRFYSTAGFLKDCTNAFINSVFPDLISSGLVQKSQKEKI